MELAHQSLLPLKMRFYCVTKGAYRHFDDMPPSNTLCLSAVIPNALLSFFLLLRQFQLKGAPVHFCAQNQYDEQ